MPPGHPAADEPCLCRSGRPFERCCATAFAADISAWKRALDAGRRLMWPIASSAVATCGPGLLRYAWQLFSAGPDSRASLQELLPVFDAWFAFAFVPNLGDDDKDDLASREGWPTASLGLTWLASTPTTVSDYDRAFIVTAAASPFSLLLVEAATPGWFLTVRDLMTDRRFRLVDAEASARAQAEDILLGAVLTLDGVSTPLGLAPYAIASDWRCEAADIRRCYGGDDWLTRAEAFDVELDLFSTYREAYDRGGYGATILDALGDPRGPLLLRWSVALSFHDALERLRPLTFAYDDEALDLENGPEGAPRAVLTWYQHGRSDDPDDWEMLGFLYLDEGRLAADVPTRALADRLIAEIGVCLGSGATLLEMRPCGTLVRVRGGEPQPSLRVN